MSPEVRVFVRAAIAGLGAFASSLLASATGSDLHLNELVIAVCSGLGLFAATASLEFGTAINPTVGKGADNS